VAHPAVHNQAVAIQAKFLEYFVHNGPDRAQRMIFAYPLLRRNVAKDMPLLLIGYSHAQ
jgi:hypothetical protein